MLKQAVFVAVVLAGMLAIWWWYSAFYKGNQFVLPTLPMFRCPARHELRNGLCFPTTTPVKPAADVCPSGKTLRGGVCWPSNPMVQQVATPAKAGTCPPGMVLEGELCVPASRLPRLPDAVCPIGKVMRGGLCWPA